MDPPGGRQLKDNTILFLFGSKSDLKYFEPMEKFLTTCEINYQVKILSAHRDLEELTAFLKAHSKDYAAIIAGAGFSAALPGVVAALSDTPVLGVPFSSSPIHLDALYSMIQMPKGIPLAVCSYDKTGLINATLLSLRICKENEKCEKMKAELRK